MRLLEKKLGYKCVTKEVKLYETDKCWQITLQPEENHLKDVNICTVLRGRPNVKRRADMRVNCEPVNICICVAMEGISKTSFRAQWESLTVDNCSVRNRQKCVYHRSTFIRPVVQACVCVNRYYYCTIIISYCNCMKFIVFATLGTETKQNHATK